jgi:diacylglycerol kinase (ATP)
MTTNKEALWILAINPTSGNGNGAIIGQRVIAYLEEAKVQFQVYFGRSSADLKERLSREISAHDISANEIAGVIGVGGDGLMHLILQICVPAHIPFAIVPAGTGNDFVRSLGWSIESIEPYLKRVLTSPPSKIDLGNADSEWFGAILSTGFDSVVNERANVLKWPKGAMRYNFAMILELAKFEPREYHITCDGDSFTTKAMLVAVGNGKSYGGGMNICPQAKFDDGLFDLIILEPVSTIEFLRVFPKVYSGSHIRHPKVRSLRAAKVSIEADAIAYADGERIGPAPISVECIKGAGLTWTL